MNKISAVSEMRKEGIKACTDSNNNVCINVQGNGRWFLIRVDESEIEKWATAVEDESGEKVVDVVKEQTIKVEGKLGSRPFKGEVLIHVENGSGGSYEVWDVESGGRSYYVAGELEIEELEEGYALVGYDGCYVLPQLVIDAVKSAGIGIEI